MLRGIMFASAVVLCAGAANADVVKDREAAMKAMSAAVKPAAGMLKGGKFDLATVQKSLDAIAANAQASLKLYPESSKGAKSSALPAVWEKKADFDGRLRKLAADASAAKKAIVSEATFKANFPKVIGSCGGCHKEYRAKKQ